MRKFANFKGMLNFDSEHQDGRLASDPSVVVGRQDTKASGSISADQFFFKTSIGKADHGTIDDPLSTKNSNASDPWMSNHTPVSMTVRSSIRISKVIIPVRTPSKHVTLAELHSNDFILAR